MTRSKPLNDNFIRIAGVTKRFGAVTAVDEVDVEIGRGEFFSILGPSGCGKTTLLRMIAGFEYPSQGAIFIDGQPMADVPANERPTNMVFQSYAIFPHLNVFDNIAYGLRKERLPRKELTQRVDEALGMIKLEGFDRRKADQLSGGQRQRVALARALIRRPKVLLLDEPLGALDKRLREAMQIELRQLQRNVGITFVFVTHDQEEALSMSDRIAVMSHGKVLQVAPPRTLYEAPNCREVADFIGTMNVFEASASEVRGDVVTIDAGPLGQVALPVAQIPAFARSTGAQLLATLRPEKIRISVTDQSERHTVRGRVLAAAYLGERSHFQVAVEGFATPVAVAAQNAKRDLEASHRRGDAVYLSWQPDALVLLPR